MHLANVTASALSRSSKAVQFSGVACGRLSLTGTKEIDIPAMWPANCPFRIPADTSKPVVAIGFLNEQITTDSQERPTRDKNRTPTYDPSATGGFTNAVGPVVFGDETTEVTIGHAAVPAPSRHPLPGSAGLDHRRLKGAPDRGRTGRPLRPTGPLPKLTPSRRWQRPR
ncbi:hypothetical protein [Kitasatospora indigofera]|uniref:hypothetical protein n=1 Tax=Kitasatospora indigofera TaxID=67307 RepID=UPI0036A1ADB2